jgi:predicted  nucleic acid-binding Zn-ribbon protein
MSPQKTQVPATVTPDENGFVHVDLDVPTEQVAINKPQASTTPTDVPPQTQKVQRPLEEAGKKQKEAQHLAQEALKAVKQQSHSAESLQSEVAEQIKEAETKVDDAKKQLKEAKAKEKDAQAQFKKLKGEGEGMTIAGYKATDFVTALAKPPQPETSNNSQIDPSMRQQLEQQIQEAQSQQTETESQIKEAEDQLKQTSKQSKKEQKPSKASEKFSSVIENMKGEIPSDMSKAKPYQAFILSGAALLIMALFGMLFNKFLVVLMVIIIGLFEVIFGMMIKKKSQN